MPVEGVSALMFADDASLWIGTFGGGAVRMTLADITGGTEVDQVPFVVRVYPNPTDGICRLELSGAFEDPIHWALSDIRGQEVMSGSYLTGQVGSMDLAPLASGIYLLTMVGGQGLQALRVTKP